MNISDLENRAKNGSAVAQSILGLSYLYGREVKPNYEKAFQLLSTAAENGASRAILGLAKMYAEGLRTAKDAIGAIRLYKSVEQAEIRAKLELARLYSLDNLGISDLKEALKYYSLVAEQSGAVEDSTTAAFIGVLTLAEVEEAKDFVSRFESSRSSPPI